MKKIETQSLTIKEFCRQLVQRVDVGSVMLFIFAFAFAVLIFVAAMKLDGSKRSVPSQIHHKEKAMMGYKKQIVLHKLRVYQYRDDSFRVEVESICFSMNMKEDILYANT